MITRRTSGVAALVAAVTIGMTGCGGSSGSGSDGGGSVTLWMYPVIKDPVKSKQFWAAEEKSFEKAHPKIDLKIEMQTFDKRDAQISAALAAGTGPDIVLITPDQAATYLNVRGVQPVDDAVADSKSKFLPAALDVATFDDHVYGVPLFANVNTTAYNTKVFKDAGLALPKTWADVRAAAPVLAKKGIAVMDYAGNPEQTLNLSFYPLLWQAGGDVMSKDGKSVAFNSPAGVSALQFLVDLKKAGGLNPDAATDGPKVEGAPIAAGKVGLRVQAALPDVKQMRAALGKDNVQLGPPLKGTTQATYGSPGLLALTSINKKDNRQAAYEVLKFLSSAPEQTKLIAASGTFPTRTDVKTSGSPDVAAMTAAQKYANPGEPSPAARQIMAALAPKIQAALRGDLSPKDALDQAAKEANGALERTVRG
ncbi:extracellular solute-binding protein [Luteipulveratus mongoliensis]|uniref:Sugar ABC transporter substrate-binding protein n=1 Tax=Luteipulveratus mongoliensis TaxID=571913 RepID=A0A0K1JK08_9MICO|nr:extracellular solute-binding protein [Luteipulveratus mongoliensis]AKU16918.1 sugar ABC transporter substrate-binding protein [Luteipulveratus mongoliensis]